MNNLIAYSFYSLFVATVVLYVGHYCHRHGAHYLTIFLPRDRELGTFINKLLLVGYYLLNIGLGIYLISTWPALSDAQDVITSLVYYISRLLLLLGGMHYFNLIIIQLFSTYKRN